MKAYIITFDFKFKRDEMVVSDLAEAIKNFKYWWHYLKNSWIIMSDKNAQEIYNELKPYLKAGMRLLIFELGKDRQGWMPKESWIWLKKNIPKT